MSDFFATPRTLHGPYLCPWNSPGQNTGVGCHSLLQGIFPTKGSNPGLLHCRQMLYHVGHQGSQNHVSPLLRTAPAPGFQFSSVQFSHSVKFDSLRPHELQHSRLPVHHQLPRFTQTHVHWIGDAIQPSHPLSSPSPPAFNFSQHLGLFKWVSSLHQVAKVLEFQLQHQSYQWLRTDLL